MPSQYASPPIVVSPEPGEAKGSAGIEINVARFLSRVHSHLIDRDPIPIVVGKHPVLRAALSGSRQEEHHVAVLAVLVEAKVRMLDLGRLAGSLTVNHSDGVAFEGEGVLLDFGDDDRRAWPVAVRSHPIDAQVAPPGELY